MNKGQGSFNTLASQGHFNTPVQQSNDYLATHPDNRHSGQAGTTWPNIFHTPESQGTSGRHRAQHTLHTKHVQNTRHSCAMPASSQQQHYARMYKQSSLKHSARTTIQPSHQAGGSQFQQLNNQLQPKTVAPGPCNNPPADPQARAGKQYLQ